MPEPAETSIQEDIRTLYQALPENVQSFLAGPGRDEVTQAIRSARGLSPEQFSEFENAFLLLMLGAYTPEKFFAEIMGSGVSEEAARGIAADLDAKVFIPLARADVLPAKEPVAPPVPGPAVIQPTSAIVSPVPVTPPSMPKPAPAPIPVPAPSAVAQPIAAPAQPSVPQIRTMAQDVEATGLGGAGTPSTVRAAPRPVAPSTPAPPSVAPAVRTTPSADALHADLKKYGIDPYREPIE